VKLVDTKGKGLDGVKPEGIQFDGKLYDLDVLVWSTGFQSGGSPAASAYMDVTGRHGKSFEEEFVNNHSTLHGVGTRDFPNLFWPAMRQAGGKSSIRDHPGEFSIFEISLRGNIPADC
jgi:cation diffusion facilitator CzcD-associated flavoprotein CzcO